MNRTPLPPRKAPLRRKRPLKARRPLGYTNTRPKPRKAVLGRSGASERVRERREKDAQWKAVVIGGGGGRCERCGKSAYGLRVIDPHHVKGKQAFPHLRFDTRNGCGLCRTLNGNDGGGCHRWYHDHPKQGDEWFSQYRPDDWAWINKPREDQQ